MRRCQSDFARAVLPEGNDNDLERTPLGDVRRRADALCVVSVEKVVELHSFLPDPFRKVRVSKADLATNGVWAQA